MKVYVARYDHRHGSDTGVFKSAIGAESYRQSIAQQWWESKMSAPMPESEPPNIIADLYFDAMAERDEWFSVEELDLAD